MPTSGLRIFFSPHTIPFNLKEESALVSKNPIYSFVIPVFNEEETLPELARRMKELLTRLDGPAEVILVDDGSRDKSYVQMMEVNEADPRFKLVKLSRNFGHQIAITAGMDVCTGKATIIMDADLQDPPEVVLDMIAKWKEGFEVVYAVRKDREGETVFKKFTAAVFYRLLRRLTEMDMPADVGDFRLVDRKALDAFKKMRERHRYVRGMFSWIGFRQTGVFYVRQKRFAGDTKYPLSKMLKLARDAIVGFSYAPLRLTLNIGFAISAVSLLYGAAAIVLKLCGFYTVTGWASLAALVCFLGGFQLIVIGILGEYLGRIHEEVKNRPLYLVQFTQGIEPNN
jgi:glycosyltransferase involved in cell wall biosynthesis